MHEKSTPDATYIDFRRGDGPENHEGPYNFVAVSDIYYSTTGEIYRDFYSTEFNRLDRIKQLGVVDRSQTLLSQFQTRSHHSIVAAIMMDYILYRNGFNDKDRKLGIVSGLLHDIATPPNSEQGKSFNRKRLNEETLSEYKLKKSPKILDVLKKHKISMDDVINTIRGNNKIGELLNSKEGVDVDNLSYIAIDYEISMNSYKFMFKDTFELHKSVKFIENQWVFDYPSVLLEFLQTRYQIYEDVYCNTRNRAKEAFLERLLKDVDVPVDTILEWDDWNFDQWFVNKYSKDEFEKYFNNSLAETYFEEVGREYDLSKFKEIKKKYENEDRIVEITKTPRHATNNLVLYKDKVVPLGDISDYFRFRVESIKENYKRLGYVGMFEKVNGNVFSDIRFLKY